ncbi:phage virion morphogenesis protein [Escherichia coli]|nr:phage virion morphogenesis protein [Escherichia coli]MED9700688.1 phage virion morphogenesis protein [Escherichia coli]
MINFNLNQPHLREVLHTIKEAELSPAKARKLLYRIAKYGLLPAAKRNVRNQQTPDGTGWEPRRRPDKATGKYKNKMLLGLPKLMAIRADNDGKTVRIYFRKGSYNTGSHAGAVAHIQQNGARITRKGSRKWSAGVMDAMREQPATRRQAHRLLSLGFRAPTGAVNKKTGRRNRRKPSLQWIMENMNRLQAGTVINILKGKEAKDTREITIPARTFLGASGEEFSRILDAQLRSLNYGGSK